MKRSALAAILLCLATPVVADEAGAPALRPVTPVSVQGYGRQNGDCRFWTDGCVSCAADEAGIGQCSTPGIACTPHRVTCEASRPAAQGRQP